MENRLFIFFTITYSILLYFFKFNLYNKQYFVFILKNYEIFQVV